MKTPLINVDFNKALLEDRFGRQFRYLRLSVTEACNFRCQYCLPDGYHERSDQQFLSLPEIQTLVYTFAQLGTSKIRITGGEPSLRRDLPEIIRVCRETPGIETIAVTTHGGRLLRDAPVWKEAGVDQINISIDSLDPLQFAQITGRNKLDEIIQGLHLALQLGIKVKVNTVLLRDFSRQRYNRFLGWIKTIPVTLRFIELMETSDQGDFFTHQHSSGQPLKDDLLNTGWQPLLREKDAGPAEEYYHPDYAGRIGLILPYSKDFCNTCNRLRVAANGNLHLCLFSEHGISLRSFLQDGDIDGLKAYLHTLLASKHATHYLHEGKTGATRHLAMLGG